MEITNCLFQCREGCAPFPQHETRVPNICSRVNTLTPKSRLKTTLSRPHSFFPDRSSQQPFRCRSSVRALDNNRDFPPVDLDIEIDPEPSAMTDIGRPEEARRISLHEHLLCALRRRAPGAEAIVVVMIGCGDELLAGDEP